MSTLYIEPFSGLAGDMLLSGLCGLANYYEEIVKLPDLIHLSDGKVEIDTVTKNGIVCKYVRIIDLNQQHSDKLDQTGHDKIHTHEHNHDHHHHHGEHHHPPHAHRHLKEILQIIDKGHISEGAKAIAKEIFTIVGKSEAKIHDMDLDKIHFHEISAVDSILDIVGCAVLIDHLEISKTYCDAICTGFGMVKTQHGLLPVPAPATADILLGMPTYPGDEEGESVTPTGAAIVKYLNPEFSSVDIRRQKIAYGPGKKDFVRPNVVRLSLLEEEVKKKAQPHQH
ncbi:MAG: LarC family nickel insertion protein [Saprospiraceae bacterium]|nr:LarC family nickel insertion protein [Saprospiraceae bacterium]